MRWKQCIRIGLRDIVFNATFNNILVVSWRSVLLVEETEENHQPATLFTEKHYYITLYRVHLAMTRFELTTLVVINTDYTDNCIFNYYTITTTTAPSMDV